MGLETTVTAMSDGIKDLVPAIVRIITAGVLSGILIRTGAAASISRTIVERLGSRHVCLSLAFSTMLLTAIGLVILLSASFPFAYYKENPSRHNPLYYFERQAVFAVLGTAVMLLVSKFNYQRLRGAGRALIYVSVIFLILVIIPHNPIAVTAKGATRWLKIGVQFQPSEIAKVAIITYFADSISRKRRNNAQLPLRRATLRLYSGSGGGPGGR